MAELAPRRRTRSFDEAVPITGRPTVGAPVAGAAPIGTAVPVRTGIPYRSGVPYRTRVPVRTGVPLAVAAPVAVAPATRGGGLLTAPVIGGLCCLGLILFLIATTVILSLIPIYTSQRDAERTVEETDVVLNATVNSTEPVTVGTFNEAQRAVLQDELQQQLNNDPNPLDTTIVVLEAEGLTANAKRKRQAGASFVRIVCRLFIRRPARFRRRIFVILRLFFINSRIGSRLSAAAVAPGGGGGGGSGSATTGTTQPTVPTTTTSNNTRTLVRRSLEHGGAPAGVVYVDAHQVAATKGNVSSVSFYVDRTCGSATVEFGAFELLNRNTEKNTAELRLVQRSGALKLAVANDLKPFMTLITIRLCSGQIIADINSGGCQGHRFPVLPHQYIGVRSDSCRLGFAPVTVDPIHRVTWQVDGENDPFEATFDKLKYIPANYTVLHKVTIDPSGTDKSVAVPEQTAESVNRPRVLFIGSFSPRQCGLAKFLEDLTDAYPGPHSIVAVDEDTATARARTYSNKVTFRLNQNNRDDYYKVAELVNSNAFDVLNVQHEYGLYGGMGGEYVIAMMGAVRKPIITTMHTVIPNPSTMYMSVTRALCATSTRVIVMAELGRHLLTELYGCDETKISVVLHGVPDIPFANSLAPAKEKLGFDPNAPIMATFGLLHRNKNVEFALRAMHKVIESEPNMIYLVIGQTHPGILTYEGESYRHELEGNVTKLGLTKNVEFIDKYLSDEDLLEYLAATDIYLTPYAREDQYVSGTLSWAVGLGKAVVSTPFLYAKELLANGRGFLVPFEDHNFLASTVVKLVEEDHVRESTRRKAYRFGRHMTWPVVTEQLEEIFRELLLFN